MRFFLIAGETSGDMLGAALMAGLSQLDPAAQFDGVGGPEMTRRGLISRFPMGQLSVMGLAEILPKYLSLKRRIAECASAIVRANPDALITIDSPDFCLRVAARARAEGYRGAVIHYVAPSVWAWRAGRAAKMARHVDHVLALLPFEPPYMHAAGMSCDFVGHPVVAQERASRSAADAFRRAHHIAADAPLILCLPGSRSTEVARLSPRFDEALLRVRDRIPELRVVIPTVPGVSRLVRNMSARWPSAPIVVEDADAKRAAFAASDLALAASGTVSLELAANRVPMVIAYDMAPLSRILIGALLKTDTVTLVNLVSETRAIPEFLGSACKPGQIAEALQALLEDPSRRTGQLQAMDRTMELLGADGPPPGLRAAKSVLDYLARRSGIQPPPSTRVPSSS